MEELKVVVYRLLLLVLVCIFSGCREETEVPFDPSHSPGSDILINSSFELGGNPSFSGWRRENESYISHSNDVPPGGESWSVALQAVWGTPASLLALVPASTQKQVYRLTIWGKRSGPAGAISIVLKHAETTLVMSSIDIQDTNWTPFLLSDTLVVAPGDSVGVQLSGGISQTLNGVSNFDLCVLEALN